VRTFISLVAIVAVRNGTWARFRMGSVRVRWVGAVCRMNASPQQKFHVHAPDTRLALPACLKRIELDSAVNGHIVAEGQIAALYSRQNR
jgi:phosphatidylethanolamine-binding protein (PEBP) family uncharacterized protein